MNKDNLLAINTPLGPMLIEAVANSVTGLKWISQREFNKKSVPKTSTSTILNQAKKQLLDFLNGHRKTLDFAIQLSGTDFQKKVWRELKKIPYGQTISYSQLAQKVGSPKATRAVGSANGKNPVPLIIPCHRVISKSGALGGFSGGLENKKRLLFLENSENNFL